jgi:hypothetical protein
MSHYCKLKAMKEFNKGINLFFHFTSDRYIKMLLNLDGKKRILFIILTPTVFLFAFRNWKDSIKQLRLPKLQFLFQPFLAGKFFLKFYCCLPHLLKNRISFEYSSLIIAIISFWRKLLKFFILRSKSIAPWKFIRFKSTKRNYIRHLKLSLSSIAGNDLKIQFLFMQIKGEFCKLS